MQMPETDQKSEKVFLNFEIIAFELFAIDIRFYWERILFIGFNMLTNSLKISDPTKREFFELILFLSNQKIWPKYWRADRGSVSDTLTCWPSTSVLTYGFLGIAVTLRFQVYNLRKKSPVRVIFFCLLFQVLCRLLKLSKKLRKFFLILW